MKNLKPYQRQTKNWALLLICHFGAIFFAPIISVHAQALSGGYECGVFEKITPDGFQPSQPAYADRFGNWYTEDEMALWNLNQQSNHCDQIEDFTLIFENNQNNPFSNDEIETICDVFDYLSDLITAQSGERAVIRLRKDPALGIGVAAVGTPFFPNQCGLGHSLVHQQLFTGGVNIPQHGLIAVNANISNFYIGPSAGIGLNQVDYYTVILHEALHVMGFGSQITPNGAPAQGFYTLWDLNIVNNDGEHMILSTMPSTNGSCCADYVFNSAYFPGMPNLIWNQNCGPTNVKFDVAQLPPVNGEYASQDPQTFMNVLSHLDRTCGTEHYVMNSGIPPGLDGVQRTLTNAETAILCRLGYQTSGCMPDCIVIAENDGAFFVAQGQLITIDISTLLANDFPSNATFGLMTNCGNTSGIGITLNGSQILIQGNTLGVYTFCYSITGCNGQQCDVATVRIVVTNPALAEACENLTDCQINPFVDFEEFGSDEELRQLLTAGNNGFGFWEQPWGWDNTPDLVDSPDFGWTCNGNSAGVSTPSGNQFLRFVMRRYNNADQGEGVSLPLCEPVFPGMSGTVTFIATALNPCLVFGPNIRVEFSENAPIAGAVVYNNPGISSPSWFVPITSTPNTNPVFATYTVNFTNESNVCWNYLYLSSFTQNEMPFPVFGTIYLDAVRVEINNNLLDVLDITTNVAPEEPCLGGQVNATIEICNNVGCDGNSFSNPATLVTAQLPPGLTLIPNADFPSLTHLVNEGDIPPGGCVVLTLALQVSSDEAFDGQTLPINLQFNPLAPCFDGAVLNAGNVTPMICTSEFACPCTEANTLNIVASPNGTPYSSLNLPATLDPSVHNGCIAIAGRLIMDQHVTITGCDNIRMQPCAEIVVPAFRHLTMEYSIIYGCEQMWQRIRAEPYSYLTFRHNKVSDGQHVLWAEPVTLFGLLTPTRVDIQHNRFERNHVNLFVPGNGGGFYGGVVWQTPFVGNNILCKGPGNTLGDLLPPCDAGLDNYDGEHGYAGAVVLGANFNIGAAGGAYNTFSNLRNGVIGERVFLNVYRSNFNNMIGFSDFQPSFALSRGVGVVANNGIYNVRDANFNGAGHALYGSNAFLSLRGSTTNKVRLGVEAWHPGARGVFDNPGIRFTDFGIRAWNLAASPWFSSHVIDKNKFFTQDVQAATDGDWTVQLVNLSNLTLPDGAGRISRNEMYVNDQVGGLLVNNLNNWAITDNRVEFSAHPNSEVLGSAGIQLQTSHYNYLYGNDITDVTGVGFNATTGFATLASLGNRFCCNGTEGGFVGSLFMGACFGTQYRQTDMASHGFSLWLPGNANTGFTVIGQQPIQVLGPATNSNRFGAASGTAWNDGPPLVLDASKFFVTNQNTPHYPQQIVTPNGVPSNWFVTNDATPYECAQDIQCPDPAYPPGGREDIEPTDILIAQNAFGSITGGAALQWEGERDLYARLKAHPDMLGQSTSVDAFYSATEAGSAVQSFHIAEAMVASVQDVPTAWGQALRTAADSIAAIEAEADAVLAALGGVSTRSDSLDIYWQSQSVRARLVPHTAVAVEKQHQMDSLRRIRALAVLPTVMALPANNVPQSNRKDALRIYLEVTSAGTAQLTEAQFDVVSPIAHQCPLAGGSAVYMARALYQMKEQKHFDDFDLCAIADGRSAKATPKPHADRVLLWPNPTDGRLQLFLPGMEAGQEVRLRVADISGRTVLERSLVTADGNLALDASRLVPGVYFCQVSTGGQTFQPVKFVIAR